jgi:hypothetical protein
MMQTSEQINELAAALSKAQGEITGALKDSANPFFKSKYSDLASCWDACRLALSKNGLAVTQFPTTEGTGICLVTTLLHSSGQWMRANLLMHPKDDSPQAFGSAITYARRYALCAVVGIAQIDDDGNAASGKVSYGAQPAYDAPHSPAGDAAKTADPDLAKAAAKRMSDILDSDVGESAKVMAVLDEHDKINKSQDIYIAASLLMSAAKRNAWKAYVSQGKKLEAAEPRSRF